MIMFFQNLGLKIVVGVYVIILSGIKECYGCWSTPKVHHSVKSNTTFYQKCSCDETGSLDSLKWLDPNGHEIEPLRPGTSPSKYTERTGNSLDLLVTAFSKNMSGEYQCIIVSKGQEFKLIHFVEAYDPLRFLNFDENQFLVVGEDSKLYCDATGSSNPLIKWYKGEEGPLEVSSKYGIQDNALIVKDVEFADEGDYKCVANVMGTGEEDERSTKVEVLTIPEIEDIIISSNNTVSVGDSLKIECKARGIPDPIVRWSKDETNNGTNKTWHEKSITFDEITALDGGIYTCLATNKAGKTTRSRILQVNIPPIIEEFQNLTTQLGAEMKLVCKATGRPTPTINITYNENEDSVTNLDTIPGIAWIVETFNETTIFTLTFSKVLRIHDGAYRCNVSNMVDTVDAIAYVSVQFKPTFDTVEELIYGWNGKTVNLSCVYSSNPESAIIWRYKSTEIKGNSSEMTIYDSFSHNYLQVSYSNNSYYGTYECQARNNVGESVKVFKLIESFPPLAIKNVTIMGSTATTLTFDIKAPEIVSGPPVIGYRAEYDQSKTYNYTHIHKNMTWAVGGLDRYYKIDHLLPDTEYYFKFAAINEVGVGEWTDIVLIRTPETSVPETPTWSIKTAVEDVITMKVYSQSYTLAWNEPESNGAPINYYKLVYCVNDTEHREIEETSCQKERVMSSTNITLRHLLANVTYRVELMAHNSKGFSLPTTIYIQTPAYEPILSSEGIIGLAVAIVVLLLIFMDLLLLFWKRQGLIASIWYKRAKKNKQQAKLARDRKGLLKHGEQVEDTLKNIEKKGHKEFEYNKSTGVITGKHSVV